MPSLCDLPRQARAWRAGVSGASRQELLVFTQFSLLR